MQTEITAPPKKTPVTVSGLPGKMAMQAAMEIYCSADFKLHEEGLTGSRTDVKEIGLVDTMIKLYPPDRRDSLVLSRDVMAIDFTTPSAVLVNAAHYCKNNVRFLMGTTGGDAHSLEELVRKSETSAIIAPNTAREIVAFMRMLERYADQHKGELQGAEIKILESHQARKKDRSGTAMKASMYFRMMGVAECQYSEFILIREKEAQLAMGIPKEHLDGHGWHFYELTGPRQALSIFANAAYNFMDVSPVLEPYTKFKINHNGKISIECLSPDQTVSFGVRIESCFNGRPDKIKVVLSHRVNGRSIYASGALDGLRFLRRASEKGKVYQMTDTLSVPGPKTSDLAQPLV